MTSVATPSTIPTESPEARRYNRIKRWLGIADFVLGLILLLALLVTGWSGTLRDLAYSGGFQNYTLAVFLYVLMLMGIGKLLGLGLDYYGFRLEHRFQLSNQKLRAWIWDEFKGFLVGVILASIVTELLYFIIREAPQHWWLLAWAAFLGLFVVQAGITLLGFWAANWTLHYAIERRHMFETLSDFANLPLLVLVSTVLGFLLLPALNAYSRFNERQADRYAFQSITSIEPFISSMNKLADQNLAERTPSRFVEWFFHSHPAIARRIAAAENWAGRPTANVRA